MSDHRSRSTALSWSLVLLLLAAAAPPAPILAATGDVDDVSLDARLADYRQLGLADRAVSVSDRTLELEHLSIEIRNGTLVPLQSAGGHVLGLYLEGSGWYTYTSEDPSDRQVLCRNFEEASNKDLCKDARIRDEIEKAVVFFARPLWEDVWGPAVGEGEGETVPVPDGASGAFERMWKKIGQSYLEYDHYAAEAQLNTGDAQYVYAEIAGKQETLGYSLDRVRFFWERLFGFRKFAGYDLRFQRPISRQRLLAQGEDERFPVRQVRAEFDISTEDNRTARILSKVTFESTRDGLRVFPLGLDNNVDPDSYDWASERNQLRVLRVTDEQGRAVPHSHRYHELLVQVAEPLDTGDEVTLEFETEGEILTAMDGLRADNYFELFRGYWYPSSMGWGTREFPFTLKVRTRKPYRPVATGQTVSFSEEGDFYELATRSEKPVKSLAVFAGKYKVHEQKYDDVTIRVHGYAMAQKKKLEAIADLSNAFIKFYEATLGDYPFPELDILEVPEVGFGIAPPATVLITSEAYKPRQDYLVSYFSRGINARLAHEIAHQWFGHVAAPETLHDRWLSESLAEYVSGLAMASLQGDKHRVYGMDDMMNEWWRDTLEHQNVGPIAAADMLGGSNAGRNRFALLYCRGPLVLRMLHSMLGTERFYQVLRNYLKVADYGSVDTADLRKAVEGVTGNEMGWFFDQWVEEDGIPVVKLEHSVEKAENGRPVLVGTARQENVPAKRLFIPLVLDFGGGRQELRVVQMENGQASFRFELPGKPRKIEVDPAKNVLAVYD